jgi:lipid II isoglutaminyl synthase (glutamine-hydrolysing)
MRRRYPDDHVPEVTPASLRIVHLFPDVLRFYGDGGNILTLVRRAAARSIETSVVQVPIGVARIPAADLVFIGGGQDREQVTVARELERLGSQLRDLLAGGAALLAVCGGYQNLGTSYGTPDGVDLVGPGILPVSTDARGDAPRLVGPLVAVISPDLPVIGGRSSETQRRANQGRRVDGLEPGWNRFLVGFENHGGRTTLEAGARAFATVEVGHGNNDLDRTEGVLMLPGEGGAGGLRIGTYLHGPLLPRNPHVADALIAFALGHGNGPIALDSLDDRLEWRAHTAARDRIRRAARRERRIPDWAHRAFDPIRALIGF